MMQVENPPFSPAAQPARAPSLPPPSFPFKRRSPWQRRLLWAAVAVALLAGAGLAWSSSTTPSTTPAGPVPTASSPSLTARGQVLPIGQARIGTLQGGVVAQLAVVVGDTVSEQQEIARVRGASGQIEVLTAPWRGTVTGLTVHVGDTVTPGTVVGTLGDLSRLEIETTDVDEFLIGYLFRGQPVSLTIDALARRQFRGYVRTVSLQVQQNDSGDDHYPVVIDLSGPTTALRPGMTARISFQPES
jgi:multidrug efflux pump subunit AcrA (membrane-fusion protein)